MADSPGFQQFPQFIVQGGTRYRYLRACGQQQPHFASTHVAAAHNQAAAPVKSGEEREMLHAEKLARKDAGLLRAASSVSNAVVAMIGLLRSAAGRTVASRK